MAYKRKHTRYRFRKTSELESLSLGGCSFRSKTCPVPNSSICLRLSLAGEEIEIEAMPQYCQSLGAENLIGAEFVWSSPEEHERFQRLLRRAEHSGELFRLRQEADEVRFILSRLEKAS